MPVEIDQSPIRKHIGFLFHHSLCSRSIDFLLQHNALPPKETDRYMTIIPSPPPHYPCITNWIKDEIFRLALSPGEKKAKHKHNPKTPTFNNPKTQTTTDHNNAETQNTSPPKGKNKKRQLNPPLSSLSNKQQEEQQTTGFNKTNQRRLSTQFSTKFSATFSECAMREHSSPSRMLHDSARVTTESKTRSFAAIPKRKRKQQKHSLVKRSSSSITESIVGIVCYLVPTYVYLVPGSMLDIGTYLPT